jgi:hemerythrin-like domain-containing protein
MYSKATLDRRNFIQSTTTLGAAALVASSSLLGCATVTSSQKKKNSIGVEEVSPVEDLLREHGALNRVLLIYDEAIRRIRSKEEIDPALLHKSAQIIQNFIENYHEKLEEEHIFPKLKKAGKLVGTVDILLMQHRAGRKLTKAILGLSSIARFKSSSDLFTLETALTKFIHMYRPHEAREDTVVFPEFKTTLTQKEYDKLGDEFEDKEQQLFGKEGFEGVVDEIAQIEKSLGIYELSKFTPQL